MADPVHTGITLASKAPSLIRALFGVLADTQLAGNRVLVADQTRRLAERLNVAERVIDTLIEQEIEVRESHTHGIRLEVAQPTHGRWSGERVEGTVNVSVRNEWVYPATLTKLVASVELPGWKALVTVTTWDKDWLIPGRSAHNVALEWSWLTNPEQLQTTTLRADRLSDVTLTVTATASIRWEGLTFTVEQPFSLLVLVSPKNRTSVW